MPLGVNLLTISDFSDDLFEKLHSCIGHICPLLPTLLPEKWRGIWGPGFNHEEGGGREGVKPVLLCAPQWLSRARKRCRSPNSNELQIKCATLLNFLLEAVQKHIFKESLHPGFPKKLAPRIYFKNISN